MLTRSFRSQRRRLIVCVLVLAVLTSTTLSSKLTLAQGKPLDGVTLSLIDNPDGETDAVKHLESQFE